MRKWMILWMFATTWGSGMLWAQTGCPGCVVELPANLPADTVYLSAAPAGRANETYSGDLSFRLPLTTTPVAVLDSTVLPGLPISQITINTVAGLPPGLTWEASATEFVTQELTDGCVRFCGTPLLPGLYEVQVVITAQVFIFSQTTSVSFPMLIEPATSLTDGFTLVNEQGCGSVTVELINNVPSGGAPGFSYFWEFGNGNSTTAENPAPQTFSEPGTYGVSYQAIVDTAGYFLTQVRVTEVGCNDIFGGAPDLKLDILDPQGQNLLTTGIIQDAVLPAVFDLYLPIGAGNYSINVVDDDGGLDGADDLCGAIPFNQSTNGAIQSGELTAILAVAHPVDTVRSEATVTVYPVPAAPLLLGDAPYCIGDSALLAVANYTDHLQWYRDSLPQFSDSLGQLRTATNGLYWATYTAPTGCQATSAPLSLAFSNPPPAFALAQNGNLLRLPATYTLPANAQLSWLLNGEELPGANEPLLCAEVDGLYTLVVLDALSGCSTSATLDVTYDPGLTCTTATTEPTAAPAWRLFPNPGIDWVTLQADPTTFSDSWHYQLLDATGRRWQSGQVNSPNHAFNWGALPTGLYWLRLHNHSGEITLRWVKISQ